MGALKESTTMLVVQMEGAEFYHYMGELLSFISRIPEKELNLMLPNAKLAEIGLLFKRESIMAIENELIQNRMLIGIIASAQNKLAEYLVCNMDVPLQFIMNGTLSPVNTRMAAEAFFSAKGSTDLIITVTSDDMEHVFTIPVLTSGAPIELNMPFAIKKIAIIAKQLDKSIVCLLSNVSLIVSVR
jgi:hypothetical protein